MNDPPLQLKPSYAIHIKRNVAYLANRTVKLDQISECLFVILVGLAILTPWTRIGAYIASAWLLLIAVNLLTSGGFFDLAVRDVEIAIAAYVLARMTEVKQTVVVLASKLTQSVRAA